MEIKSTNVATNRDIIISSLQKVNRPGIKELLNWLDQTDFYTAPASVRHHGAFEGGLCLHSIYVCSELSRINAAYDFNLADDSIILVALLHDLCKIGLYEKGTRNQKNAEGKWETVPCYTYANPPAYGDHGGKSVFQIMQFVKLTYEEASAIQSHMGAYDLSSNKASEVSKVYSSNKLAWALHVADEAASFIIGC